MATVFDEEMSMVKVTLAKAREIGKVLHDLDGDTQGAVLADVVAVWVVSHRIADDHAADAHDFQLDVLMGWLALVVRLMPAHEVEYLKQLAEQERKPS